MHINAVQDQVETKTFGSTLVVHTIVINRLCKRNTFSTCSYLRDAVVERGCDGLDHWLADLSYVNWLQRMHDGIGSLIVRCFVTNLEKSEQDCI